MPQGLKTYDFEIIEFYGAVGKNVFMKAIACAVAASFLTVVCAPAFAAHGGGASEKTGYVQQADNKQGKNYSVARNGADDKNHDEFDDHGGR